MAYNIEQISKRSGVIIMNQEFKRLEKEVVIQADKNLVCKDNHKDVARELKLENEIEMLEAELKETEKSLSECNHKNFLSVIGILVLTNIAGYAVMSMIINTYRFGMITSLVWYLSGWDVFMAPFLLFFCKAKNPFLVGKRREELKLKIEYLKHSLERAKGKLEEIVRHKNLTDVTVDKDVVSLTDYNKDYRKSLETKLELLVMAKKLNMRQSPMQECLKGFDDEEKKFIQDYLQGEARKRTK